MEYRLDQLVDGFERIVVIRHKYPDLDAYGAQFGLTYALRQRYPQKNIIAAGDTNAMNHFGELVPISLALYENALVFVLDTVAKQMLENTLFEKAKKIVLIDHHLNDADVFHHLFIHNTAASSTSEIICDLLTESGIPIPSEAARPLFLGIVGDTGRFQYSNTTSHTFEVVGDLLKTGIDIQSLYQLIYAEPLKLRKLKSEFAASFETTSKGVAYRKNDREFLESHQVDTQTVSRGMVNQMAGISEIPIWANFTFDTVTAKIVCELRSRTIPIVDIAKKYGGGGHLLACGCTVDSWEDTLKIVKDLDSLLEETNG